MQIVIDIPEDNFNRIRELAEVNGLSNNLMGYSLLAIAHGTVLPKGHGRLIDADTLDTRCGRCAIDCAGDCDRCSDNVVSVEDIRRASTIIEADKEAKNEDSN